MAEINVPAPKAMMIPRVRLLKENLVAISPPTIKEDVANNPQKNEFTINLSFPGSPGLDFERDEPGKEDGRVQLTDKRLGHYE